MSTLNDQLNHLSTQEKQRLRDRLLHQLRVNHAVLDTTTLSHAQQRLWIVQQLNECNFLYNVPVIVAVPSTLNLAVLRDALHLVIRENPVLLSAFTFEQDRIVQHQKNCDIFFDEMTLEYNLPDIFEVTSTSPLASFFLQPFDLEKAPLFRMMVLKTPGKSFLLGCFHHLIIDGWSVNVLIRKLQKHYQLIEMNEKSEAKLAPDYFAYVAAEKAQVMTEDLLTYWKSRLQHKPLVVDFVTDYPRKLEKSNIGQTIHHKISSTIFKRISECSDFSINQCVLFAFQFMLARYSGQHDIAVGMPISGRMHERWQDTIGLFVNTLIHTADIEYSRTVREQLELLKETLFTDLAHAEIPFDVLVKAFYEEKLLHQTGLFNVLYNFISTKQWAHDAQKIWPMHYCTLPVSKFDLSLHVFEAELHVDLFLEFSTDLFDVRTIRSMLRYLLVVLEALPEHFEKSLKQLNLACFKGCQYES